MPLKALICIVGAALSWGIYVPTVHLAQMGLKSSLRGFFMVGIAYFITAVIIPAIFIFGIGDPTVKGKANFDLVPVLIGLAGGALGAAGALCIIFAVASGAKPLYVAPLVFAGAPIINTLATIYYFAPVKTTPDWRFFAGLLMAACGAAMVMIFKPVDVPAAKPVPAAESPAGEAGAPPAAH